MPRDRMPMPRGPMPMPRGAGPIPVRGAGAALQGGPDPRMMAAVQGAPSPAGPTGAPQMPRYNARALRPGGMSKGGKVKYGKKGGMTRGDGTATRGHTRGKMV